MAVTLKHIEDGEVVRKFTFRDFESFLKDCLEDGRSNPQHEDGMKLVLEYDGEKTSFDGFDEFGKFIINEALLLIFKEKEKKTAHTRYIWLLNKRSTEATWSNSCNSKSLKKS